jgi:hypothetical protein
MKMRNLVAGGMMLLAAVGAEAKQRAVRIHTTVATIGTQASATNNGPTDTTLQHCLEDICTFDTIKPGQTKLFTGLPADKPVNFTLPGKVSIQGEVGPIEYTSANHVLPTLDPNLYNIRVGVLDRYGGRNLDIRFLEENGAERGVKTIELQRGITWFNPAEYFGMRGNQQLEMNAPGFIELTNKQTGKKTIMPAKPLSSGAGEEYLAHTSGNTMLTSKNTDPGGVRGLNAFFLAGGQDNSNLTVVTPIFNNNYGITTRSIAKGTGAALIQGEIHDGILQPTINWGTVDGDYIPTTTQFARARSGVISDLTPTTDLIFGGVTNETSLYLVSRDKNTGIVKVTDANGNAVKEYPFNLMNYEPVTIPLNSLTPGIYRASVQLDATTTDFRPQVAGVAGTPGPNGTIYREGSAVVRPAPRVSGEQYVAKWFDPIKGNIVYLDGREGYCMINGNCGTKSYAPELAAALFPTSNYPGTTKDFENFIRGLADGNPNNGELYKQKDPVKVSGQSTAKYQVFALDPNDQVINVDMNSSNLSAVQSVYRSFLIDMTNAHPEDYGGSATNGLNDVLAPGWDTRHNNDANGRRLSE